MIAPPRTVQATRYVTPLREGGSLPAVVEADDDGLYVMKFRGAGQGPKALVAELVAGNLARALGLPVPEIVFAGLDAEFARTEPDPEIQDLIRASEGLNLGLDYLPGALNFDAAVAASAQAQAIDRELASRIVWFDAYVSNVDRSVRNPNLMVWHRQPWLIDHGAALYFHHDWASAAAAAARPFVQVREHVLLPLAGGVGEVDAAMAARLDDATIDAAVAPVPDDWLLPDPSFADADAQRRAYADHLKSRLAQRRAFVQEAIDAHAAHV